LNVVCPALCILPCEVFGGEDHHQDSLPVLLLAEIGQKLEPVHFRHDEVK
jgi:hypothetical protein